MPTYTYSEIRAYGLLQKGITTEATDYHEAGNVIIHLAEQIKAERAIAAMEILHD